MKIFSVHPADRDLNFFRQLNLAFVAKYGEYFTYLRLDPNYHTHETCLKALKQANEGLVLFFCHALDKSIRGCRIESPASSRSYKDFVYGNLISPTVNTDVFDGKRVFCLACNSNELGVSAVKAGAHVYLGFGDIPFFIKEKYKEATITNAVKLSLLGVVRKCLEQAIDGNYTFNELSNLIRMEIDIERYALLSDKSVGINIRREVSKVLSRIKTGMTMFGDGNIRLLN